MIFHREIKDFIKKMVLLSIVLSFFVNLLCIYFGSGNGTLSQAHADNESRFARRDTPYLGVTAVALSNNIGTQAVAKKNVPVDMVPSVISVGAVLADQ